VCLYRGCIPSKALLHVARVINEVEEVRELGVDYPAPEISLNKLREWKDSVVARMTEGLGVLAGRRKIDYLRGAASFRDAKTIEVRTHEASVETLTFENAIIATGSLPVTIPSLDIGSPRVMNAKTALDLESIPETLLVVGGGYIGLELGSVYAALGSRVSVVEMLPGLLPGADRDLVAVLAKRVKASFESVMLNTQVSAVEETKGGVKVTLTGQAADEGQSDSVYEKVLVSVGRKPNSGGLGLDQAGVSVDSRGFIEVDSRLRTSVPSIFAIGDVIGEPMLAHKASHEGRTAVEVIAGREVEFAPRAIPAVVFTDPEIAWCGLTGTQVKEQGLDVTVTKFPWAASGRATTLERVEGMTKLLVNPKDDRLLGAGIVGVGAGDMIAEMALAMEMGATAADLERTIHPHPTLSETLMEAAEVYYGHATHVHRPRKK
jgi:dihydrolipoamide dehydrogenase